MNQSGQNGGGVDLLLTGTDNPTWSFHNTGLMTCVDPGMVYSIRGANALVGYVSTCKTIRYHYIYLVSMVNRFTKPIEAQFS